MWPILVKILTQLLHSFKNYQEDYLQAKHYCLSLTYLIWFLSFISLQLWIHFTHDTTFKHFQGSTKREESLSNQGASWDYFFFTIWNLRNLNTVEILIHFELSVGFDQYWTKCRVSPVVILSFLNNFNCIYWFTNSSHKFNMVSNTEDNSNLRQQVKYYLENVENVWSSFGNVCFWPTQNKKELIYTFPWNKQKTRQKIRNMVFRHWTSGSSGWWFLKKGAQTIRALQLPEESFQAAI